MYLHTSECSVTLLLHVGCLAERTSAVFLVRGGLCTASFPVYFEFCGALPCSYVSYLVAQVLYLAFRFVAGATGSPLSQHWCLDAQQL